MEVRPGLVGEVEIVVQPADTTDALGNEGVHVLATPRLVGLLEQAAIHAVQAGLPAGAGSVGTRMDLKHLPATPIGMKVRARAVVREVDGRRYVYDIEAHDEQEKVAEGTHERFQINQARFLERVRREGEAHELNQSTGEPG